MTKKDLKTGMVVETRAGIRYLVLEEFKKLIGKDNFMEYHTHNDDLTYSFNNLDIMKVYTPSVMSFNQMLDNPGEPIWKRPQYYDGKVVCIDNDYFVNHLTVGKIYNLVDGNCETDCGIKLLDSPVSSFEELTGRFIGVKFIEVVE